MQLLIMAGHNVNSQNKISLYNIRSNNIPLFFSFQASVSRNGKDMSDWCTEWEKHI